MGSVLVGCPANQARSAKCQPASIVPCPGPASASALAPIRDRPPAASVTIPGLQRITPLRCVLRCAREHAQPGMRPERSVMPSERPAPNCASRDFSVGSRRTSLGSKGQSMKNYLDGGEAILEAFRKLKVDYIMSSPGSEWSPVWEALARQKLNKAAGPTFVESWHENVAVNMATGYTLMTGRPQAVLLHAAVGMLQGSMGVHGAHAERSADGGDVGRIELARRRPGPRHRAAVVRRAHRRRHRAVRRAGRQMGALGDQPLHALRKRGARRRNGAARAARAGLSQRAARTHAARLDAAARMRATCRPPRSCRRPPRTCSRSPTC